MERTFEEIIAGRTGGQEMSERRFNPELMGRLDNPERRKLLPPEQLLELLHIQEDSRVLDLGAGTGYFAIPAAALTRNVLYALDVSPEMLEVVKERVKDRQLSHVEFLQGEIEQIPLEGEVVDRIIASFVLHEVEPLEQGLKEINRVLKPEGKVLCVEWEKQEAEQGPPLRHRIHSAEMARSFEEQGFIVDKVTFPSAQHYVMIATKRR